MIISTTAAMAMPMNLRAENPRFHVPAEDEPHEMTFMQWPVSASVYPDKSFLKHVQKTIVRIANTISEFEPLVLLADKSHHETIKKHVSSRVDLWDIPTDDLWCRDAGPIFATNGRKLQVQHIKFNGWGNRQSHKNDGKIAERVAERLGIAIQPFDLQGEAGGVEQDGFGTLIAHESSWIHQNRNPHMTKTQIESALLSAYGADRIIWSKGVKNLDVTDYHIDSLVRFTKKRTCLINLPDTPDMSDEFHAAAFATFDALTVAGLDVEVISEPNTRRIHDQDFVASYANYYVCNGGVIMSQFGDRETDALAKAALQRHFANREVITLNVDALGELGGGIHCATHEMPRV